MNILSKRYKPKLVNEGYCYKQDKSHREEVSRNFINVNIKQH
jgi:hypothetical protein